MVNIYEQKLTNLQQEILRLLFVKAGKQLNQRSIARALGVSQPAVKKAIPAMDKQHLVSVKQDEESRRWSIGLNRENEKAMQLKRVDNLRQMYESGLSDMLEMEFAGATIILFGSYSRGEDTESSDIDLAIIGRREKAVNLEDFEKTLGRSIRLGFYESFGRIHKNLRENLFNGIVLAGGVEL